MLQQYKPDLIIKELGSGMNYEKAAFMKLLTLIINRQVEELILTRKDRLLRFGSKIIFRLCRHFGVKTIILMSPRSKSQCCSFALMLLKLSPFSQAKYMVCAPIPIAKPCKSLKLCRPWRFWPTRHKPVHKGWQVRWGVFPSVSYTFYFECPLGPPSGHLNW